MATRDLSNAKTTILGATLGAIPRIAMNPPERFSFAPAFSELFFHELGWSPRARFPKCGFAEFGAFGDSLPFFIQENWQQRKILLILGVRGGGPEVVVKICLLESLFRSPI